MATTILVPMQYVCAPETGADLARKAPRNPRNRTFDLLRLCFAMLVLLSHAPELTDGNRHRELLNRLTGSGFTLGGAAVDGFFLLSGFLILKSWLSDPDLWSYLQKRVLRIVPGYLVAALASTLIVGLFAAAQPHFFSSLGKPFWVSVLTLNPPTTPVVWAGNRYPYVNGSLWSIAYEFRCYLLIAIFGTCRLFRFRKLWLGLTVVFALNMLRPTLQFHFPTYIVSGEPGNLCRLLTPFLVGGCFLLFRDKIRFRSQFAVAAGVFLLISIFCSRTVELGIIVFGGYLIFYLGQVQTERALRWFRDVPDISYGVYLYGWPVQSALAWGLHISPWLNFAISVPVCLGLGWLSWKCVEGPMLKLAQRARELSGIAQAVPLPA